MTSGLIQGALWDRRARDWTCLQEAKHLPLRRSLLRALEPLTGVRLLDVGCGVGLLLREAADRGAWIAGVDTAPELLEVARWALPDADLSVATLESLPYDNGRFDAATACNALRYADDQIAALTEMIRVVRPGGRVAIGDWGDPNGTQTREFCDRLGQVLELPPATLDLSSRGTLESHLRTAGLDIIVSDELDFPFTYADLATAWSAMVARGLVIPAIEAVGKEAVYETFLDVFGPAVHPDGSLRDQNIFRYVIATKPV